MCGARPSSTAGVIMQRRFELGDHFIVWAKKSNSTQVGLGIVSHPTFAAFSCWDISWHAGPSALHPVSFFSLLPNLEPDKRTIRWAMVCGSDGRRDSRRERHRVVFDCCRRPHPRAALESPLGAFKRWRHDKGEIVERRLLSVREAAIFSESFPCRSRIFQGSLCRYVTHVSFEPFERFLFT